MHDKACERPHIVHVSGDFPDPFAPNKTPVVRSLIDLTADQFRHGVISINRVSPSPVRFLKSAMSRDSGPVMYATEFPYGIALQYQAAGRGIFHASTLRCLGDELASIIARQGTPDLLVGHKLTIEGLVVARAAARLNIPYALCIQGNTDAKILTMRPDLQRLFGQTLHGAAHVFPFAPWALGMAERHLGKVRPTSVTLLPCPTDLDEPMPPTQGGDRLISVFHLRHHAVKNLAGLAMATQHCVHQGIISGLDVIGGGTGADLAKCRSVARRAPQITFAGPLARDALRRRMNRAIGLALPSRRESFGLVFIEALFAGLPIIYPAGAAVDGYFDDLPFALPVDARNPRAIARGMAKLVTEERQLKAALASWQQGTHAEQFRRASIAGQFAQGLECAVHQGFKPA
ncbi:MAG: glycosyltransferase [Novosphingobium sp.]|nr:glycosyltransferase [Novosphingobium sp.]